MHYPKEIHRNSILVAANVLLYSHMHMIEREMRTYDSLIHNGFFVWATPFIEPEKGWCRLVLFLELSMRRKPRQMTTKKEQEQQESMYLLPSYYLDVFGGLLLFFFKRTYPTWSNAKNHWDLLPFFTTPFSFIKPKKCTTKKAN